MRIVIVGGGQVGSALARALSADHEVSVIDHDPDVGDVFQSMNVEFLPGSGTNEEVLAGAGVARSDFFVAATGLDEVNIVACALANRVGHPQTICLVSRAEFLDSAGVGEGLAAFGVNRVVWPEAQLAADIERIVTAPGAIDAEVFAGGIMRLLEYRLDEGSPLTSAPVSGLHLPRGALIVAVKRAGRMFVPRGTTQLQAGDKVVVMGTPDAMQAVEARVHRGRSGGRLQVTIIGGGDVGFQLAQRLEQIPSIDLRILERGEERGAMLAATLRRTLVLNGDGTDLEFLESENVGRSDVLVSVIDNDERNLLASLLGRQLGVPKVITRVGRPANLRLFERVGIDVAISARGAAVDSILHTITGGATSLLAVIEHGEARVFELTVKPSFAPRELKTMGAGEDAIVAAILRGEQAIVPRGDDLVRPGDRLVVFCTQEAADRVREYFTREAS
jgi:trk system potassium uptake protein TrkA